MNMGPGQAKQCQLRAFLTYYINDLFLNQVWKWQIIVFFYCIIKHSICTFHDLIQNPFVFVPL